MEVWYLSFEPQRKKHRIKQDTAKKKLRNSVSKTNTILLLGISKTVNYMCKLVGKKNSILLDNKKRVRLFFRKPRYTHYCSVWYIIQSVAAAAEEETANGADRRARIN